MISETKVKRIKNEIEEYLALIKNKQEDIQVCAKIIRIILFFYFSEFNDFKKFQEVSVQHENYKNKIQIFQFCIVLNYTFSELLNQINNIETQKQLPPSQHLFFYTDFIV